MVLTKDKAIVDRWKEHFDELLNSTSTSPPLPRLHLRARTRLTTAEVARAIERIKSGKAAGEDEIRPEMLNALGGAGIDWLTRVFQVVWDSGEAPMDWQTGVIVPVFKKGDNKECTNYRGITLLSLPGKLYAKVHEARIRAVVEPKISNEQCGFRPGRSTTDQIHTLRLVCEKAWEYKIPAFLAFVDLEKAYDRVPREKLWKCLREYGVDEELLRAVQSLYDRCTARVRVNGLQSSPFTVRTGLRQGCALSPVLFLVFMDRIVMRC